MKNNTILKNQENLPYSKMFPNALYHHSSLSAPINHQSVSLPIILTFAECHVNEITVCSFFFLTQHNYSEMYSSYCMFSNSFLSAAE